MAFAVLALKLTLAPALVATATRVARRLGHDAGGIVGGFPVVAGPILLIYAVEHGAAFAQDAARATVLGIVSLVGFCLAYAVAARRVGWPLAVLAGWAAFGAGTMLFDVARPPLAVSAVLAALAVGGATRWFARIDHAPSAAPDSDLMALRLLITAALVLALTAAAGSLSPWMSGLVAPFPVITAVLAGFTHAQVGQGASIELLGGLVPGLVSFVLFFLVLAVGVGPAGVVAAFVIATAAALASHAALVAARYTPAP